jgi:glucose/arabinose dehydrogenase
VLVFGLAVLALLGGSGRATSGAAPEFLILQSVGAFSYPVYATAPPGDQDRLFVVQVGGVIKLVLDGVVQPTPFLDASGWITSGGEQGLLSMAFAPDYATSGRFYVDYTAAGTGALTVDEVQRDASDPNVADPGTRRNVISTPHPTFSNHNGGQLQFGPDGMLYISTGDGGGGGDPFRSAQNLHDRRGKLLRIDPREDGSQPYRVPPNNPFVGVPNAYPEIWSYGLRNPWRFSFDRLNGELNIGDVGEGAWEETDYRPVDLAWGAGANFGWSCFEGRHPYNTCTPPPFAPIPPIFE